MGDRKSEAKLPPVDQIGVVVKDVDKAMAFYRRTLGWGPFNVMEDVPMEGCTFKGETNNCRLKLAFTKIGDLEIELIQVLEGETLYSEFLREKGEGLHHLRCAVEDVDGMIAEMVKDGIEPVFSKEVEGMGTIFAYMNTDQVGGVMLELINSQIKAMMGAG